MVSIPVLKNMFLLLINPGSWVPWGSLSEIEILVAGWGKELNEKDRS
jgi:hypothetical protein